MDELNKYITQKQINDPEFSQWLTTFAILSEVGKAVSQLRISGNLSVADVAGRLGWNEQKLIDLEAGELANLTVYELVQVSAILRGELKFLLSRS